MNTHDLLDMADQGWLGMLFAAATKARPLEDRADIVIRPTPSIAARRVMTDGRLPYLELAPIIGPHRWDVRWSDGRYELGAGYSLPTDADAVNALLEWDGEPGTLRPAIKWTRYVAWPEVANRYDYPNRA